MTTIPLSHDRFCDCYDCFNAVKRWHHGRWDGTWFAENYEFFAIVALIGLVFAAVAVNVYTPFGFAGFCIAFYLFAFLNGFISWSVATRRLGFPVSLILSILRTHILFAAIFFLMGTILLFVM